MSSALLIMLLSLAAVSLGAEWHVLNKNIGLVEDLGIAVPYPKDPLVAYAAGISNSGPLILKTIDGGLTFAPCNITSSFGVLDIILDIDAADQAIVVSSVFGELYSDDGGKTFQRSLGGGTSQSVRLIGPNGDGGHKFGCAGSYGQRGQGAAISTDSGRTFKVYNANLYTLARYGAYPSDSVWYIAAGDWPSSSASEGHVSYRRSQYINGDGSVRFPSRPTVTGGDGGYTAQISKTEDGGKTFSTVFAENSTFYFNGIDCSPTNPNTCCAVGEGSDADAGARIHCTTDGGKSWNRTFYSPSTSTVHYSLLELRYASDTEVWAVGGALQQSSTNAWFVHSSDGGKTWAADATLLRGFYGLGVTMLSPTLGFAAMVDVNTQTAGIAKFF